MVSRSGEVVSAGAQVAVQDSGSVRSSDSCERFHAQLALPAQRNYATAFSTHNAGRGKKNHLLHLKTTLETCEEEPCRRESRAKPGTPALLPPD